MIKFAIEREGEEDQGRRGHEPYRPGGQKEYNGGEFYFLEHELTFLSDRSAHH